MEKSKTFLRAAGILMGATMLTTCVLGGTLAQYLTEGTATGSATVADWNVVLSDDTDIASMTCDLFSKNVYDLDDSAITNPEDLSTATGNPDDSVKTGVIAPGTWGKQEFQVTNKGDVDASVTITINESATESADKASILKQLQFSTDGTTWNSLSDTTGLSLMDEVKYGENSSDILTLYWKWTYDDASGPSDSDNIDNDLAGKTAALVDVTISADQTK